MPFLIASVDTKENPYFSAVARKDGYPEIDVARAYFWDFVEICDLRQTLLTNQLESLRIRYMMLVECLFDEGDVQLIELRGWVDGAACAIGTDSSNFEWLHDAFEWVLNR